MEWNISRNEAVPARVKSNFCFVMEKMVMAPLKKVSSVKKLKVTEVENMKEAT